VKVGVVSDGVAGLATAQASGDLPEVEVLSRDVGGEGTALLEIIHDCAPGAALAFAASGPTTLTFIEGVNALRAAGAAVIVDDIFFLSEPYFEDGGVARNDRVVGTAVLRVSAAGNDAEAHYQGTFVPGGPGGTRHNFGGGDTLLRAQVPFGAPFIVVLQWDNPFGRAGDDYDLFVRNTSGVTIGSSRDAQTGDDDPLEVVVTSPCAQASGCLADIEVSLFDGVSRTIELFCFGCEFLEFNMRRDSVFGHPAVPEVLAVTAVPASTPGALEPYSSAGPATIRFPTAETRFKPDLAAVDCVTTSRPDFTPFCGTSAAAPHVAAVAALVMQALGPSATPQAVRDILIQGAVDLGPAGPDPDFGFGRVDALNAVDLGWPPRISLTVTLSGHEAGPGATTILGLDIANPGGPVTVDVYLVAQVPAAQGVALGCPAGDALLFFTGAVAPTVICASTPPPMLPAIAAGVTIPSALAPVSIPAVLEVTWPPGLLAGSYTFALALLKTGAFADGIIDPGEVVAIGMDTLTYMP
jgi:subtilisin family serine protease